MWESKEENMKKRNGYFVPTCGNKPQNKIRKIQD